MVSPDSAVDIIDHLAHIEYDGIMPIVLLWIAWLVNQWMKKDK